MGSRLLSKPIVRERCEGTGSSVELQVIMTCEDKARLAKVYEAATDRFSVAVTELRRKIGVSAKQEYESLNRAANEARLESEHARLALEHHIASHNC